MNYVSHIQERKEKDGSAITNEKTKIKLIKRGSTMLNKLPDRANIKNGKSFYKKPNFIDKLMLIKSQLLNSKINLFL